MKKMTRQEVIDILVEDEMDAISDDTVGVEDILREGFIGYNKMLNRDLEKEYEEFCEEKIRIVG